MTDDGPYCPECDEPVGADTEYCMHCYQNFSGDVSPVDTPPAGGSGGDATSTEGYDEWQTDDQGTGSADSSSGYEQWKGESSPTLDPEGLVDNTLTVIVGIVAGLVIGVISIIVFGILTEEGWGVLLGFVIWLGVTAHLVRRYTVQETISHAGYAFAAVLMVSPLVAAAAGGPGLEDRLSSFFGALMFAAIPAVISGSVGWFAGQFVPEQGSEA